MATFDMNAFFANLSEVLVRAVREGRSDKEESSSSSQVITVPVKIDPFCGRPNENLQKWIFQLTDMFDSKKVALRDRLKLVSAYLDGHALQWYISVRQAVEENHRNPFQSWDEFITNMRLTFDRTDGPLYIRRRLRSLRQTSSVYAYINEFRDLAGQLPDPNENDLLVDFIEGLKDSLRRDLLCRSPVTLNEAVKMATNLDNAQPGLSNRNSQFRKPEKFHPSQERQNAVTKKQEIVDMELGTLNGGKQRNPNGKKCSFCKKNGHTVSECWKKGAEKELNMVGVKTDWEKKNNENASMENAELNLVTNNRLLTVKGAAYGESIKILVDSGASLNFVDKHFVQRHKELNHAILEQKATVQVADGSHLEMLGRLKIEFRIKEYHECILATVIDIAKYDLIVGKPWLFYHNPIIDWRSHRVEFINNGKVIVWEGDSGTSKIEAPIKGILRRDIQENEELLVCCLVEESDSMESDLNELMTKYEAVFREPDCLPPKRKYDHVINTGDAEPISQSAYRMSPLELDALKQEIDKLLMLGFIRPSRSPWASPVLFVRKKDGSLRLCVDYRALNRVTRKHDYPIPRIEELMDRLAGAEVFSRMDLASGYHQLRVSEEDIEKTAFKSRYGQFEYTVMPFGLTNAPASFQKLMNELFFEYLDNFVIIYLDDILVYSSTKEEHKKHLEIVMEILKKNNLKLKKKKCEFFAEKIEFLGFVVSSKGIHVEDKKIHAISSLLAPNDVESLRTFLGLVGFYRKFVAGFAQIASPLTDLLKKGAEFKWGPTHQTAFEELKKKLETAPVLIQPNFHLPFVMCCDASGKAIGGVLSQEVEGILQPIAYESRKLSGAELNYPVHEQELLAIVHCCKVFRCYIEGRKTRIQTDHASLKYLKTQKNLSRRMARWLEFLETLDIQIEYYPGKLNVVADALSRLEINLLEASDWPRLYLRMPEDRQQIAREEGEAVLEKLEKEQANFEVSSDIIFRIDENGKRTPFVPFSQRLDLVNKIHCGHGHLGVDGTYNLVKERAWWPGMQANIRAWLPACDTCQRNVKDHGKPKEALHPLPLVGPFQRWSMDFIGRLPLSSNGNRWIITAIDHGTRWPVARAVPEATTLEVAKFLYETILTCFGCPVEVLTDRGSNFMSEVLGKYLEFQKIKHLRTSAYHPRTNGLVEKFNGLLGGMLRKLSGEKPKEWDCYIEEALFNCRIRSHSTTGVSPFYLVYGCYPLIPGDLTSPRLQMSRPVDLGEMEEWRQAQIAKLQLEREEAKLRTKAVQEKTKEWFDKKIRPENLQVGQLVYRRNETRSKFDPYWDGPFRIAESLGKGLFTLQDLNGAELAQKVHVDRLKQVRNIPNELLTIEDLKLENMAYSERGECWNQGPG